MTPLELDTIWDSILGYVGQLTGRDNISPLFSHTKLISTDNGYIVVSVPNRFLGDMICDQYYDFFVDAIKKVLGVVEVQIQFVIAGHEQEKWRDAQFIEKSDKKRSGINPAYDFTSFVVGTGNQFAHAASRKVAESPGTAYNPLFIYGDVGLGKTHLLSAVGNYIKNQNPKYRIVYITAEQFTNDVIHSIRHEKMVEFRNRYRNIDMLLIDDIQFIAGKERTQEEFFHTFNTLYEDNKQVVFSADRPAKEMSDIEERLRSRFEMGLVADIQPPDLETKIAILYKKADADGISLPADVADFLASHTRSNVRELEGALIRLGAHSSLMGIEITLAYAKTVLKDVIVEVNKEITTEDIIRVILERFPIKAAELKSKKRTKNLVFPRQVGMYLCRELTKSSFPEIGLAFGGKDHSTVIHACKQIDKAKDEDHTLKTILESLTKKLREERR